MSDELGETNAPPIKPENNPKHLETTAKAVGLYKQIGEEVRSRGLGDVIERSSYAKLTVFAALNEGNVSDTLDRYQLVNNELRRQGVETYTVEDFVDIAYTGLLLEKNKPTKSE